MKDAKVDDKPRELGWFSCLNFEPLSNWVRIVWQLSDDQIQKMNGTDYTLYLVYLRYAGWLCLILTGINLCLMIPIYASGVPKIDDNWKKQELSSMNKLTILNITASEGKFIFVYIFTILFVSSIAYCMVILYQVKYEHYKHKIDPLNDDFDDISIARYSLFIKNLPTNIGVEDLQRLVSEKMMRLYPQDFRTKQSQFVKFRVVGDYN